MKANLSAKVVSRLEKEVPYQFIPLEICEACQLPIEGKKTDFGDHVFHFECLKCEACNEVISKNKAVRMRGRYFHEGCYLERKVFKCVFCKGPIMGPYVKHKNKDVCVHIDCYPMFKDGEGIV